MNKTTTNKTTTHKDSLDAGLPLEDHELDSVSGGVPHAQAEKEQADALKEFQQVLNKAGQI